MTSIVVSIGAQSCEFHKKVTRRLRQHMESFTHEEFITALRMQGKGVAVTADDVRRRESQAKVSKANASERWSKARDDEEINRERRLRDERKKVAAQLASVAASRTLLDSGGTAANEQAPPAKLSVESMDQQKLVVDGAGLSPSTQERSDEAAPEKTEGTTPDIADRSAPVPTPLSVEVVATQIDELASSELVSSTADVRRFTVEMWWEGLVDLDLSCIALSVSKELRGLFFFGEQEFGAALSHSGDMLSAPPPLGAKEAIVVDTTKLPQDVGYLYFMMTAFSADTCAEVHRLLVRVVDGDSSRVISGVNHVSMATKRAACLCRLVRAPSGTFELHFVEDLTFDVGDTVRALAKDVVKHAMRAPS